MNAILKNVMLPQMLNEIMTSDVNCNVERQFAGEKWPRVDILENENSYTLKAELPGIDKSGINIVVEQGILRIEGERKSDSKSENEKFHHIERNSGKFSRSFSLPEETDSEHIEAKMENGVLELTIPKTERAKPKSIEVKVN